MIRYSEGVNISNQKWRMALASEVGVSMNRMSRRRSDSASAEKDTGRIEAFSDGVFAIAITLIVLEIHTPPLQVESSAPATHALDFIFQQGPSYAAYVVSFLTILVMWINHHNLFKVIGRVDNVFLLLNGFLLMVITFLDYPTALVATYINNGQDGRYATMLYCGVCILVALGYQALWFYATYRGRLVHHTADDVTIALISRQYKFGPTYYLVSFGLAFFNAWASMALNIILVIYFSLTGTRQAIITTRSAPMPYTQSGVDQEQD